MTDLELERDEKHRCTELEDITGAGDEPCAIYQCHGCGTKYRQWKFTTQDYARQYWLADDQSWGIKMVWPIDKGWDPPPIRMDQPMEWKNVISTYQIGDSK